jgi:hypothetical protein
MFVSVLTLWDKPEQTAAQTVVSQNTQVKELAVTNNIAQLLNPIMPPKLELTEINIMGNRRLNANYVRSRLEIATKKPLNRE